MLRREELFFGSALLLMLVAASLIWAFFFSTPYTFRSDCRQIGPSSWECAQPAP